MIGWILLGIYLGGVVPSVPYLRWVDHRHHQYEFPSLDYECFWVDPESNWDICPVCIEYLSTSDEFEFDETLNRPVFPGFDVMRAHHEAHKAREPKDLP